MRTFFRLGLAVLAASCLTALAWARYGIPEGVNSSDHAKKSHHWRPHLHSNKGGKANPEERAEQTQETKADRGAHKKVTTKKQ